MPDYSIFGSTPGPATSGGDGTPVNLAHQINVTGSPRWALGLRFYRGTLAITGPVTGRLWRATGPGTGELVNGSDVTFVLGDTTGWKYAAFTGPIPVTAAFYKPSVHFEDQFPVAAGFWQPGGAGDGGLTNGPLTAPDHATALDGQGSFSAGPITTYPATGTGNGYGIDLVVTDTAPGGDPVAEHTVAAGDQGKYEILLAAGVETTVTFSEDLDRVEISNDNGAGRVYFTVDGTPATVRGANCRQLPAALHYAQVGVYRNGPTVVRLISEAATMVSVAKATR